MPTWSTDGRVCSVKVTYCLKGTCLFSYFQGELRQVKSLTCRFSCFAAWYKRKTHKVLIFHDRSKRELCLVCIVRVLGHVGVCCKWETCRHKEHPYQNQKNNFFSHQEMEGIVITLLFGSQALCQISAFSLSFLYWHHDLRCVRWHRKFTATLAGSKFRPLHLSGHKMASTSFRRWGFHSDTGYVFIWRSSFTEPGKIVTGWPRLHSKTFCFIKKICSCKDLGDSWDSLKG